jgi:hypothetical protein
MSVWECCEIGGSRGDSLEGSYEDWTEALLLFCRECAARSRCCGEAEAAIYGIGDPDRDSGNEGDTV